MLEIKLVNMKRITKIGTLALIFFGMVFASCTKNDENTIVLIGEERYIDDIRRRFRDYPPRPRAA